MTISSSPRIFTAHSDIGRRSVLSIDKRLSENSLQASDNSRNGDGGSRVSTFAALRTSQRLGVLLSTGFEVVEATATRLMLL